MPPWETVPVTGRRNCFLAPEHENLEKARVLSMCPASFLRGCCAEQRPLFMNDEAEDCALLKEYIETGKIVSTQGLKGEVRAEAWCDEPSFLADLPEVHVGEVGNLVPIEWGRAQKRMVVLKFRGVDDIDAAVSLRGKVLYIHRSTIPLEEGEHLIQDLLGCKVVDADSAEEYGELCQVSDTGANKVYHIRFHDGSIKLVPVIPQVILQVDVENGTVVIRPLEGLFD